MRRFEQATSKNKVSHNAISSPCKAKAQTKILGLYALVYSLPNIQELFLFFKRMCLLMDSSNYRTKNENRWLQ